MSWLTANDRGFSTIISISPPPSASTALHHGEAEAAVLPPSLQETAPPSPAHSDSSAHCFGAAPSSSNNSNNFTHLPDPRGVKKKDSQLTHVHHSSNPAFIYVAIVLLGVTVLEVMLLQQRLSVQQRATVEIMVAVWSLLTAAVLAAMFTQYDVTIYHMTRRCVYTRKIAGCIVRERVDFDVGQVRGIVVRGTVSRTDAKESHQFETSSERSAMRHEILINVDTGVNLLVDNVVGGDESVAAAKSWAGLMQRCGSSYVEVAASPASPRPQRQFPTRG